MGTYIRDTAGKFLQQMDFVKKELEEFSVQIENRNQAVFQKLREFEDSSRTVLSLPVASLKKNGKDTNDVEKALAQSFDVTRQMIREWHHQIEINSKGTNFMHKNEKYLVVMVFGAVKAGKSELGNFLAGKELQEAPFDNAYKHIENPKFDTEEKGRNTGGIERDVKGRTWFCVNSTDTTGNIQYFTLSGLRWIDSPGTGALAREGDIRNNMEEMVNEYIPYTDLCIFLINSSEPGLQSDFKYMDRLSREGQEALIVITKSDTKAEYIDENGEIRSDHFCAKSAETRKLQEDDICRRVHLAYPEINENKFRVISISTIVAKEAVQENNEQKFKDSHLDQLMKILGEKASAEAVRLKERKPKENLNHFIDKVIGSSSDKEDNPSLFTLKSNLERTLKNIQTYQESIEEQIARLIKDIYRNAEQEIELAVQQWSRDVEKSGKTLSGQEIAERIDGIIQRIEDEKIAQKLTEVIGGYQHKEIQQAHLKLTNAELQKETQEIQQNYVEFVRQMRDPCGVWENIRSFFGKTYYSYRRVNRTMKKTIDLGTNKEQLLQSILPQVKDTVQKHVRWALTEIKDTYFAPQEQAIRQIYERVNQLEKELNTLKFEE